MQEDIASQKLDIDFKAFFYDSALPMCVLTTDMKFIAVNKQVLVELGYDEDEMIGASVSSITAVGNISFDFENLQKLLKKEINSYSLERSYRKKDGSELKGANTVSRIEFKGETYVLAVFHRELKKQQKLNYVSESNETLNRILSINPDIHYIMDIPNKTYIYQNIDILKYFGYSEKDLNGKNKIEFLVSRIDASSIQEVAQANQHFKKSITIGEFVEVEYKFLSKNEGWKWLRAKSTPLAHSAPDRVSLSYGFIQDITHQKEIEEKLLAQEAFVNQIANLVPDVVAVYDINTYDVIYSNLKNRTFLGYTEKEWSDRSTVKPKEEYRTHLRDQNETLRNLEDEEVFREEVEYYNKQGDLRWIVVKSKVFTRDKNGKPNQILIVASDINNHKRALINLAEAKRTTNAIIGAIPDLLLVVNREGTYTNVISGVELKVDNSSDLIGRSLSDVLNPTSAEIIKKLVASCLDTGEVKYHSFKHNYSDGRPTAYFSNYLSKLNAEEVLIIARDETQKELAQKSLDDKINLLSIQNDQLEKFITKNSELERFAYIIAHDLKEPLRSISAISELIELEVSRTGNDNLEKLLRHLSENSSRMTSLIEGVLAYSRIDSERVEFPINLDELIQNIIEDLQTSIVAKEVDLQISELGSIKGDETQIRQLFQNLISNAIKFQSKKSPKLIIGKRMDNEIPVYFVEDNGIGIAPEFRKSIFMMFKRVNNYEEYPGQGIGLSMCKKVIESHGGRIWIEDANGQGSRFCFTIASD